MSDTGQANTGVEHVVNAYFDAIQKFDFSTVSRLYSESLTVWHNFTDSEQDKASNLQGLRAIEAFTAIHYHIIERHVVGNRVAQRHRLQVTRADGRSFDLPVAIFLTVEHGQITRVDEYFDSAQLTALSSPH